MGASAGRSCLAREPEASPSPSPSSTPRYRPKGRECCDLNSSFFGEDAFYRDNFYDCSEGDASQDHLFKDRPVGFAARVKEQVRLKFRKGSHLASYAKFAAKNGIATCAPSESSRKLNDGSPLTRNGTCLSMGTCASMRSCLSIDSEAVKGTQWLGSMPEWTGSSFPESGDGPYWQKGTGMGLMVRDGPNYKQNKKKTPSSWSMYEALSLDALKYHKRLENVIGNLVPVSELPRLRLETARPDLSGGSPLEWSKGCPLPRLICLNLMLPYDSGISPWAKDDGCSVVGFFQIRAETLHHLRDLENAPPCVKLFKEFFEGPAGSPSDTGVNPDRSLEARLRKGTKKDEQDGLLKAVAFCENPQDANIPETFTQYNGKPCLITKSGYIVKDPNNEWLEIGVDVRRFNLLARKCLGSFRSMLPKSKIHYGFWIQGTDDGDLPEGLICDVYCHGFNMHTDPHPYDGDEA